jgi:hypothetical protein
MNYADWAGGEPNNLFGRENYVIIANWTGGHWVDVQTRAVDYLVEYSGNVTVNTAGITATGSAFTQGRTLYTDASQITDADGMGTIAWHWQRSSDNGATWSDISGATQASYTLAQADVGKLVRSEATYVDGAGNNEVVFSPASSAILAARRSEALRPSYKSSTYRRSNRSRNSFLACMRSCSASRVRVRVNFDSASERAVSAPMAFVVRVTASSYCER